MIKPGEFSITPYPGNGEIVVLPCGCQFLRRVGYSGDVPNGCVRAASLCAMHSLQLYDTLCLIERDPYDTQLVFGYKTQYSMS